MSNEKKYLIALLWWLIYENDPKVKPEHFDLMASRIGELEKTLGSDFSKTSLIVRANEIYRTPTLNLNRQAREEVLKLIFGKQVKITYTP